MKRHSGKNRHLQGFKPGKSSSISMGPGIARNSALYRRALLGRMIAGLMLTMAGVLVALLSPAAAAGNTFGASHASGLTWLAVIVGLVLLAFVIGQFRSRQKQSDGHGSDPVGHNLPSTATGTGFKREAEQHLFDEQALLAEIERCLALSRSEGRDLSLLAVGIDEPPAENGQASAHTESIQRSLKGLAQSRGATLLRVEDPEFMVLATDLLLGEAMELAKALTRAVSDLDIPHREAPCGILTASVGAALGYPEDDKGASAYLEASRRALSRARSQGGNRVESEIL